MGKPRIDEYEANLAIQENEVSEENIESTTPKKRGRKARVVALWPTSIKLTPTTRGKIFREVARRKEHGLPNRTVQGVVSDAVDQLVEGK